MKYEIELITTQDVQEFTKLVQSVDCDVRLMGKDDMEIRGSFLQSQCCAFYSSADTYSTDSIRHKISIGTQFIANATKTYIL